jgi:hypothetical protein
MAFNKIRLILLYNGDDSVMYIRLRSVAYCRMERTMPIGIVRAGHAELFIRRRRGMK